MSCSVWMLVADHFVLPGGRGETMQFVESLTALMGSFLVGLLIEWVLLRGLVKLIGKQSPGPNPVRDRS
jgi:hypothetical protein